MKLTYEELKAKRPCPDQFKLYCRNFPDPCEITLEGLQKAAGLGLDFDWFANQFLPVFAQKAYDEATILASKAYEEAITPAWKTYDKAITPAWKAYKEAVTPARKAYKETITLALWQVIVKYGL